MPQKKAVTPWEKEFARLERRRRAYQARHARPPESRLDRALEDKVPPKLREALNSAFVKAFDLVFQRGTGLLERTFDAEAARQQFEIDQFAVQLKGDRSSLRVFSRRAGRTGALNLALSGAEGTLLGLLGIGLPDIPLFTGVLLKSLYQMAARYGYGWDTPAERYYLLLLVQGALSWGGAGRMHRAAGRVCPRPLSAGGLRPGDTDPPDCLSPSRPPAGDEICPGHPHPRHGWGHL